MVMVEALALPTTSLAAKPMEATRPMHPYQDKDQ